VPGGNRLLPPTSISTGTPGSRTRRHHRGYAHTRMGKEFPHDIRSNPKTRLQRKKHSLILLSKGVFNGEFRYEGVLSSLPGWDRQGGDDQRTLETGPEAAGRPRAR